MCPWPEQVTCLSPVSRGRDGGFICHGATEVITGALNPIDRSLSKDKGSGQNIAHQRPEVPIVSVLFVPSVQMLLGWVQSLMKGVREGGFV